jgi:hypothetical protein
MGNFVKKLGKRAAERLLKKTLERELGKKSPSELRVIAEKLDAGLRQAKGNELVSGFCHIGKHESCQQTGIMPTCCCECHKKNA